MLVRGLAWPYASGLWSGMAGGSGLNPRVKAKAAASARAFPSKLDNTVTKKQQVPEISSILFVEDNPAHRLLLRESLKTEQRARAQFVADGEEALDFLFRQGEYASSPSEVAPDIVFLDLRLPGIDGFEVLSEIRGADHLSQTPVIILTTSESEDDRKRALASGANAYLVKPWDIKTLKEEINSAISKWTGGPD